MTKSQAKGWIIFCISIIFITVLITFIMGFPIWACLLFPFPFYIFLLSLISNICEKTKILETSPKQELAQSGFLSSEIDMLIKQDIPKDTLSKLREKRKAWLEHLLAEGIPLDKYVEEVKSINKEIKEKKE